MGWGRQGGSACWGCHAFVLQIVLGGVTSGVHSEAELPVLISY
jgi:hypothetical protein